MGLWINAGSVQKPIEFDDSTGKLIRDLQEEIRVLKKHLEWYQDRVRELEEMDMS